MSSRRFSRFRNLESGRPKTGEREAVDPSRASSARFGALETEGQPAPATPASSAEGHLARFDAPNPELHTARESAEAQPFLRCMQCEGDNNRYARECMHCHADLLTAEQRAFNERLWAERLAIRQQEQAAHAAHQAAQVQAAIEAKQHQRRAAEAMAREVGARTRARLDADDGYGYGLIWGSRWRRERALRAYMWRNPGVAAGLVVVLAVANLFTHRPPLWRYGPIVLVAAGALFWGVKRLWAKK